MVAIASIGNRNLQPGFSSPAIDYWALTPHDSTDELQQFRAIYVGVGGNIVVVSPTGNAVTFLSVPTGAVLPVTGKRINSTSTTATNLVGLA